MRALVLAALVVAPVAALAADVPCGDAFCPDLVVDALDAGAPQLATETFAAGHCAVVEGLVDAGTRTLLRFPLTTANVGAGAVVLGVPAQHPAWFENSTCHGHKHFTGFAAFRLWDPDAYPQWAAARAADPARPASEVLEENPALAAQMVAGRKQGFCLMDSEPVLPTFSPPGFPTCGHQGLSAGWKDRYVEWLDGQWIDVTGVPSGYYVLELEVNPERRIAESTYGNEAFAQTVWVG